MNFCNICDPEKQTKIIKSTLSRVRRGLMCRVVLRNCWTGSGCRAPAPLCSRSQSDTECIVQLLSVGVHCQWLCKIPAIALPSKRVCCISNPCKLPLLAMLEPKLESVSWLDFHPDHRASCSRKSGFAFANGHITLNTPVLVRSLKLSNVESC